MMGHVPWRKSAVRLRILVWMYACTISDVLDKAKISNLGRFNVVVKIVAECLNVRDIGLASLRRQVTREKNCPSQYLNVFQKLDNLPNVT